MAAMFKFYESRKTAARGEENGEIGLPFSAQKNAKISAFIILSCC